MYAVVVLLLALLLEPATPMVTAVSLEGVERERERGVAVNAAAVEPGEEACELV
jgi:hypothetical protein